MGALKVRVGSTWVTINAADQRWNTAWGIIASSPLAGPAGLTTTEQTLATLVASTRVGRRYVVTAMWRAFDAGASAGSAFFRCSGIPGDTSFNDHIIYTGAVGVYGGGSSCSWRFDGNGATVTLVLTAAMVNPATGNLHAQAGSAAHFFLQDVGPVSGSAPVPDPTPPWITITGFLNGWVNYGLQAPQIRKIGDIVYLRGAVKSGTVGSAAFTMPVGYRPPVTVYGIALAAGPSLGYFIIDAATGSFIPAAGNNSQFELAYNFSVTP